MPLEKNTSGSHSGSFYDDDAPCAIHFIKSGYDGLYIVVIEDLEWVSAKHMSPEQIKKAFGVNVETMSIGR